MYKVKLCDCCPYEVGDIAACYDSGAEMFCCAACPRQGTLHTSSEYPREDFNPQWRRKKRHGTAHAVISR